MHEVISSVLGDEALYATELDVAYLMSYEVADMFGRQPRSPRPLDVPTFNALFDQTRPTVAIDAIHKFAGAELLGIQPADCNIVYTYTPSAGFTHSQTGLTAERGMLVTPDGRVVYGAFPHAIPIDLFETVDIELLEIMRDKKIQTPTDPALLRMTNDKRTLHEISESTGLQVPKRYTPSEIATGSDVVIKPSQSSQGRGVLFSSRYPGNTKRWGIYHDFLEQHGYEPIIEERIHPWPLHDPESGEQLDWNVRAIVSHGKFAGMYVRIAEMDNTVNKSTGARCIRLEDLKAYLPNDGTAKLIIASLHNAAVQYAEDRPDFIAGIDLTVDNNGQVILYESNIGHLGGLQTMATLAGRRHKAKLEPIKLIMTQLTKEANAARLRKVPGKDEVLPLSRLAMTDVATIAGKSALAGQLLEISSIENTPRDVILRLLVSSLRLTLFSPLEQDAAVSRLFEEFPLELDQYIDELCILGIKQASARIDELLRVEPLSTRWNTARGKIAASQLDLAAAKKVHAFLLADARPDNARLVIQETAHQIYQKSLHGHRRDQLDEMLLREISDCVEIIFTGSSPYDLQNALQQLLGEEESPVKHANRAMAVVWLGIAAEQYNQVEQAVSIIKAAAHATEDDGEILMSDFFTEIMDHNMSQLLQTREGAQLLVDIADSARLLAVTLDRLLGDPSLDQSIAHIIIDLVAELYAAGNMGNSKGSRRYNDSDKTFFSDILKQVVSGKKIELPSPGDNDSALRLLAILYALKATPDNARIRDRLGDRISTLDNRFGLDVDLILS